MKYIKIYGMPRTGTNYLRFLLEENFDVMAFHHILGGKHGAPCDPREWIQAEIKTPNRLMAWEGQYESGQDGPNFSPRFNKVAHYLEFLEELQEQLGDIYYVILVKNPYAWLSSWWRYILARGYRKLWRIPKNNRKWLENFNQKYRTWWRFYRDYTDRSVVMRYEDAVFRYRDTLKKVEDALLLDARWSCFMPFTQNVALHNQGISGKLTTLVVEERPFPRREYYRSREYLKELGPDWVDFVTEYVDWDLMRKYGYEPEPR